MLRKHIATCDFRGWGGGGISLDRCMSLLQIHQIFLYPLETSPYMSDFPILKEIGKYLLSILSDLLLLYPLKTSSDMSDFPILKEIGTSFISIEHFLAVQFLFF